MIFFQKTDEGFIIEDFSVDDFGNHTFTDFELSAEQNMLIMDNRMKNRFWGMLHSHHKMQCFFSGTDQDQLADGSDKLMYFVSLIVNNDGNWCARMGWVVNQESVSYGAGSHLSVLTPQQPIRQYYYTDLKIVKKEVQPVTDPKALKLLELKERKLAAAKAYSAAMVTHSQVAKKAQNHQFSIEDMILDEILAEDEDAYYLLVQQKVTQVFCSFITDGKQIPSMTIEKLLQLPTTPKWKTLLSDQRLRGLLLTLDNICAEGTGIDVFHEAMDTINSIRSQAISKAMNVLEHKLIHTNGK